MITVITLITCECHVGALARRRARVDGQPDGEPLIDSCAPFEDFQVPNRQGPISQLVASTEWKGTASSVSSLISPKPWTRFGPAAAQIRRKASRTSSRFAAARMPTRPPRAIFGYSLA